MVWGAGGEGARRCPASGLPIWFLTLGEGGRLQKPARHLVADVLLSWSQGLINPSPFLSFPLSYLPTYLPCHNHCKFISTLQQQRNIKKNVFHPQLVKSANVEPADMEGQL